MKYEKFDSYYILRIDPNEEIITKLHDFCDQHKIFLAKVSAIGAVKEAEIGYFDTSKKQYNSNIYAGDFEIVSLSGNITQMNKQPYLHLHITLADSENKCFGGHLNKAIVSATCELFIETIDGQISRKKDNLFGLNLI